MTKVFYIQASPRGQESYSIRVADAFVDALRDGRADVQVDTLNLFAEDIPTFDAPAARAKYAVLAGQEPSDDAARAWKHVIEAVGRLKAADVLLIASPMWNFSVPYRLKHWLDVIVQPALTFTYSPQTGYAGLVTGRLAVLCLARGSEYAPGSEAEPYDFQKPYLHTILGLIGFADIRTIVVEPTVAAGAEAAERKLREAMDRAAATAGEL
ncbi:hypothetical protein LCGC14_2089320 [marine sediment metagenome]|uniref:FMN-dependent NADH-azoreductase n=1 Tax=marine sediment metagenome TaxID=412755 RepID=A0A0F9HA21_9ZZZZ